MKEKIERLSKGIFEYELPALCLSEDELRIGAEAGSTCEGSFSIGNTAGRRMKGLVYSSSHLLSFQNRAFSGIDNTVTWFFDASRLSAGEVINGKITIVSDCGERELSLTVLVEAPGYQSSLGKIKDLYQFTNLARMDWTDAKRVFRSEDFERIFLQNDEKNKLIYRTLRKSINTSQALEEFLIAVHKKSPIHLSIDKTAAKYLACDGEITDRVTLTKDHWGYAEIKVSTDAPFIRLDQKFVWADHFIGNTQQITFTIDSKNLKRGNHYGRIWIRTVHQTLTVEVALRFQRESEDIPTKERQRQKTEYSLFGNYLNFRLNRIGLAEYVKDSGELLAEGLKGQDFRADLFRTHLAIISGNNSLAERMLRRFAGEEWVIKKSPVIEYCAYLYLEALYRKDDATTREAADTIRKYYENGCTDWQILWFLLYTDRRYDKNKSLKLIDIREQFENGCHSPMLYYEAAEIYNEEPYLLRDLKNFELQVMNFGIRHRILSKDTVQQYTYLAGKQKIFHPIIFHGLVRLYEEYETDELLFAICCILIKGLKKSQKYFEWYRRGVQAQLPVTELFEYYLYSADETNMEPLASPVLLYFIYNSSLNDRKRAYLYANIIHNRGKNEAIYRSYYKRMEVFAMKQLEAHHISQELSVLYREFFDSGVQSREILNHLPYVLFRHEIICDNPNIVGVAIIHRELETEENQQLNGGKAMVDIYTGNAEVFFVDSIGNRYVSSIEYQMHPLMQPENCEKYLTDSDTHPMLLLHLFDRYQSYRIMSERAIGLRKQVLKIDSLKDNYRTECLMTLMEHYYEQYNEELLEDYLGQIDISMVKPADRNKLLEYLIIRSFYDKAMEALEHFSYEKLPVNRLVRLCSGWITDRESRQPDPFATAGESGYGSRLIDNLSHYVFQKGKYDDTILSYLADHYCGSIQEMAEIWQAARNFELETHKLEERLISQLLFTEDGHEDSHRIFDVYYREVNNRLIVRAYLTYHAYRYLVHDDAIPEELLGIMKRELNYEENDICLLAWLKYSASGKALSESDISAIEYALYRLEKKGIVLPFFVRFGRVIRLSERLTDKCFVEHRADPRKQVYIHYRMLREGEPGEYCTERMPNVILGIHVKEFVLFCDEKLQYYITEESGENAKSESGSDTLRLTPALFETSEVYLTQTDPKGQAGITTTGVRELSCDCQLIRNQMIASGYDRMNTSDQAKANDRTKAGDRVNVCGQTKVSGQEIASDRSAEDEESDYIKISRMIRAYENKDEQELLILMEHYVTTQYMISQCFQPMD